MYMSLSIPSDIGLVFLLKWQSTKAYSGAWLALNMPFMYVALFRCVVKGFRLLNSSLSSISKFCIFAFLLLIKLSIAVFVIGFCKYFRKSMTEYIVSLSVSSDRKPLFLARLFMLLKYLMMVGSCSIFSLSWLFGCFVRFGTWLNKLSRKVLGSSIKAHQRTLA